MLVLVLVLVLVRLVGACGWICDYCCPWFDRDAPNTLTKSIKFVERPSMEQLWRQLELVTNCFKDICNHDGDLDLMLTISLFS